MSIMSQLALRLFQTAASVSIGAWLIREAIRAIRAGEARGRYLVFRHRENPGLFWLIVTLQAGFSGVCLVVLVRAWMSAP